MTAIVNLPALPSTPCHVPPGPSSQASAATPTLLNPTDASTAHRPRKRTRQESRNKAASRANRLKKRQKVWEGQPPGSSQDRVKALQVHTKTLNGIKTTFNSASIPIAATGYVALRQPKSTEIHRLKELVGRGSRYGFRLVQWDGR